MCPLYFLDLEVHLIVLKGPFGSQDQTQSSYRQSMCSGPLSFLHPGCYNTFKIFICPLFCFYRLRNESEEVGGNPISSYFMHQKLRTEHRVLEQSHTLELT